MGLSSSLYAGISGLSVHSEQLTVISNNLANVNTVGYKGARMDFEDVMSQDYPTASGIAQIGRGVRVASVFNDFGQGSFSTTSESTDMAISGNGFFIVKVKDSESQYYTRAGNFRFDADGYLVDPHGYVLQGWAMEQTTTSTAAVSTTDTSNRRRIVGVPTDIRLENFQSPPKVTSNINIVTNLDPSAVSASNSATNPYFAMFENWNGTAATPLNEGLYSYSTSIKVYDEIGAAHTVTVYFDKVTLSDAGGYSTWEYMVTTQPADDGRAFGGTRIGDTSAAGVMMVGTLTFRTGQLVSQSAFTLKSNAGGNVKDLSAWTLASFSTSGYPVFTPNFLSQSNASLDNGVNALPIEMNFGLRNTDLTSNGGGSITRGWSSPGVLATNAAMVGNDITHVTLLPTAKNPAISALATQSYDTGGSSTLFQSQNGYTAGVLLNVSVSRDGVLSGQYSNGQTLELYSLTLATFTNQWGLRREGGNLFSETLKSGPALTGQAGSTGKGTVDGNSLELSNVDMATEFVNMITSQRGFQANTKVITTADSLLGEVIAMKR
ncbi:flagellar hook protein FlgE [Desulfovibrio aminophilus]|nr:flagellar hook protein FlgE [Desulfovibrio aminophilus]MCM0754887.1 flagellar hook protein FlgE [Desulfovibrio aminophilus]